MQKTVNIVESPVRSSCPELFCKKSFLKNFAKLTRKHLYQRLFFRKVACNIFQNLFLNKVAGLRPATLLKKRLWHRCFPVNFAKFLRTPFLTEHLRWVLLNTDSLLIICVLFSDLNNIL